MPEGAPDQVITHYTCTPAAMGAQLKRWCLAAGVQPWPKLFQNLRASRATELVGIFPSHVCAAWLGHTERIADRFYRSVKDEHFKRATEPPAQNPAHSGIDQLIKNVLTNQECLPLLELEKN